MFWLAVQCAHAAARSTPKFSAPRRDTPISLTRTKNKIDTHVNTSAFLKTLLHFLFSTLQVNGRIRRRNAPSSLARLWRRRILFWPWSSTIIVMVDAPYFRVHRGTFYPDLPESNARYQDSGLAQNQAANVSFCFTLEGMNGRGSFLTHGVFLLWKRTVKIKCDLHDLRSA